MSFMLTIIVAEDNTMRTNYGKAIQAYNFQLVVFMTSMATPPLLYAI